MNCQICGYPRYYGPMGLVGVQCRCALIGFYRFDPAPQAASIDWCELQRSLRNANAPKPAPKEKTWPNL